LRPLAAHVGAQTRRTNGVMGKMRGAVATFVLTVAYLCCSAGSLATPESTRWTVRAPRVRVSADGRIQEIATSAETVGELLELLDIDLSSLDRTDPSPDTAIADGMAVRVTRVAREREVAEAVVEPGTITLADPDRPPDYAKTLRAGKEGLVRRTTIVWTKDGQEVQRAVAGEAVIDQPRDEIVLRGAQGVNVATEDWRLPLVMEATAYEPGPRSCGKWADGRTAIGMKAKKGVVAVDDRLIPMRTRLYIPGYGFAVAADRGSAIKGMRIDLCYPTYAEAIRFGRKRIKVYILS
jgi:3D (Asp-Asp-Asp) domain-containing protein